MAGDSYRTVAAPAEAACRERSSKFLSWIYPVRTEEEIRERLDALRKRYYDATHHCYAWRLGPRGEAFRANDDGEPSGTAGKPILGQLLSNDITDCLVVVVRYFGGTKLAKIYPEHLFLGLLKLRSGRAIDILMSLGLDFYEVKDKIEQRLDANRCEKCSQSPTS